MSELTPVWGSDITLSSLSSPPPSSSEHGAIPVLTSLIRHQDPKVVATVLGALKNLSFGRTTTDNKHAIASDHALMDIMMALRNTQV